MKHLFYIPFLFIISLSFSACGDDYIENGIEGQWQMRTIVREDGTSEQINDRFYLFKRGVFKYIEMYNDLDSFVGFGSYYENGEELVISLEDEYLFWNNCPECEINWGADLVRNFKVLKRTSSVLEMEYNNEKYIFRKY